MRIKPKLMWRGRTKVRVAEKVRSRADEAAQLAKIPGQHRLTDPRTNPAVRAYADELRDDQHRQQLGAEHARIARRYRVQDRRASRAEQALAALQDARDAGSAAKAVLALHAGRTRFMGAALAASLTLSAGSAMGVENLAVKHHAHPGSGYIAEIGLTGLTTTVILYRSHIAQNRGATTKLYGALMWVLMVAPLATSMTANAVAAGAVGVFCSVGAAAFSLLSYIIADTSAQSILKQADRVSDDDEDQLRDIASGDELFAQAVQVQQTFFEDGALNLKPLAFDPRKVVLQSEPVRELAVGSETQKPDQVRADSGNGSETRSDPQRQTQVPDPNSNRSETHGPDRSADQVPDPNRTQVPDLPDPRVPDPDDKKVPDQVPPEKPKARKTQTGPKKQTRSKPKPLDRLAEAKAADKAYLAEHGRHIPAEKLARALSIGKPAALELVKQVRGGHLEIAK